MRVLLIHQNFPGQFRQLAAKLAARGHELVAIGRRPGDPGIAGLRYGSYALGENEAGLLSEDRELDWDLRRAQRVRSACLQLLHDGWSPDAVLFHSAWGEGLYLRDVFPTQRLIAYPELYGTPRALGYGMDPHLGDPPLDLCAAIRHRNLMALAAITDSDAQIAPTRFQRDSFPAALRGGFRVIHEGVDLQQLLPNPQRWVVLRPDLALRCGDPVVTFCSRHLEPLRGLHPFLRSLVTLQQRHARVQVLIVGENTKGYGPANAHPQGHLGELLDELSGQLDLERIHFLGRVDYQQLLGVFHVSAVHVYLTYPYALSWSLLEAMACGAAIVASAGAPVDEVIVPEQNGLLVDFNSPEQLAGSVLRLLEDPALRDRLAREARRTVEQHYDLQRSSEAYEAVLSGHDDGPATL